MILTLYEPFRHWSETGSVYILSDLHFADADEEGARGARPPGTKEKERKT